MKYAAGAEAMDVLACRSGRRRYREAEVGYMRLWVCQCLCGMQLVLKHLCVTQKHFAVLFGS
jgi:hypothetical protein